MGIYLATEADVEDFLNDVGTPRERAVHLRLHNSGHMPYVEAATQDVQLAINEFVTAAAADIH
jgi:hypothetical protein